MTQNFTCYYCSKYDNGLNTNSSLNLDSDCDCLETYRPVSTVPKNVKLYCVNEKEHRHMYATFMELYI